MPVSFSIGRYRSIPNFAQITSFYTEDDLDYVLYVPNWSLFLYIFKTTYKDSILEN